MVELPLTSSWALSPFRAMREDEAEKFLRVIPVRVSFPLPEEEIRVGQLSGGEGVKVKDERVTGFELEVLRRGEARVKDDPQLIVQSDRVADPVPEMEKREEETVPDRWRGHNAIESFPALINTSE